MSSRYRPRNRRGQVCGPATSRRRVAARSRRTGHRVALHGAWRPLTVYDVDEPRLAQGAAGARARAHSATRLVLTSAKASTRGGSADPARSQRPGAPRRSGKKLATRGSKHQCIRASANISASSRPPFFFDRLAWLAGVESSRGGAERGTRPGCRKVIGRRAAPRNPSHFSKSRQVENRRCASVRGSRRQP